MEEQALFELENWMFGVMLPFSISTQAKFKDSTKTMIVYWLMPIDLFI